MSEHNKIKITSLNYFKDRPKSENPVKIEDITLRDGHQSLFATRGRTEDMIPVAEMMDEVGFWAIETWGGATFDTMHRYLNEDPWQRIRTLKKYIKKTPFSMLLRGQNLVGYRNYADDIASIFVQRSAENGIDIFRTFDALNDYRNFETVVPVIKNCGKHFQGCICYSLTEPRLGGLTYNLEYYIAKAKELEAMCVDSICIKDMAGLLAPYDAYALVKALKASVKVPINLHSHFTSGMAQMTHLKAIEAGVDIIDTCMAPYAYRTSHPAIEPLVMTLLGTNRDTGFDIKHLAKINEILEKDILPKYKQFLDETKMSIIDINVLLHQTPGGMLSNLVDQLKEMNAVDKINEVYAELPKVRKELGQIPLVTPTSQIVGTQTVNNVLFDNKDERYKMITDQVKDLCYGLYGKTTVPIDSELQKKALKSYSRGEHPITCRPASVIEPELEKAKQEVKDISTDIDDVLIYALYPVTGKKFLNLKYGKEKIAQEIKAKSAEEAKVEAAKKKAPPKTDNLRIFNVFVDNEYFEVGVEQVGGNKPSITHVQPISPSKTQTLPKSSPSLPKPSEPIKTATAQPPKGKVEISGTKLVAPMPGMVIRYEKKLGDVIKAGETIVVLEAMKMENSLPSPINGVIKAINFNSGDSVAKNDVLCVIE